MAILAALQAAALRLMGQRPSTFFGSSQKFEMELADLVNEVATDVQQYQDWQALVKRATVAGDGVTTDFDMPADYSRMLLRSDMQDGTSPFWGYDYILDVNDFYYLSQTGFIATPGGWALFGNQLHFAPAPATEATYPYISKNYARDATGVTKPAFTADTDEFLLPERLLTLGLVWRWREQKGTQTSDGDQQAFVLALDQYGSKDKGSRIQRSNGRRMFRGVGIAWPYTLGGI